jgi:hypothetical protein
MTYNLNISSKMKAPNNIFCLFEFSVKPVAVNIVTKEKHVSADKRYEVECKASGSRPEAVITWWKGSRQIKRITKNVSSTYIKQFILELDSNREDFQKSIKFFLILCENLILTNNKSDME